MKNSKVFVTSSTDTDLAKNIRRIFLEATDNLFWLKKGDLVLLKPALNSGDPYPTTTHPLAISVVSELLIKNGAQVIVGDQSGIEHVVHSPKGVVRGSSKNLFMKSGMGTSETKFVGFEEFDWEKGFFKFEEQRSTAWKNGFYATNYIQKVDHVINLPRLSTHVCAGVTLGMKNLVGILRQDSRIELHADGPFSKQINSFSKGSDLETNYPNQNKFLEKIAEISLCLKNKLRLTLYVGTSSQTLFGPDRKISKLLNSFVPKTEKGLVFASSDIVSAEVLAYAYLKYLYNTKTPFLRRFFEDKVLFESHRNRINRFDPWNNPTIKHSASLGIGNTNFNIDWGETQEKLQKSLKIFK